MHFLPVLTQARLVISAGMQRTFRDTILRLRPGSLES